MSAHLPDPSAGRLAVVSVSAVADAKVPPDGALAPPAVAASVLQTSAVAAHPAHTAAGVADKKEAPGDEYEEIREQVRWGLFQLLLHCMFYPLTDPLPTILARAMRRFLVRIVIFPSPTSPA